LLAIGSIAEDVAKFVEVGQGRGNNFFKAVYCFMSSKYGVPSSNRTSLDINNLLEGR
jgi:hypothetical protein